MMCQFPDSNVESEYSVTWKLDKEALADRSNWFIVETSRMVITDHHAVIKTEVKMSEVHPTANGKYSCSIKWENGVMIESEEVKLTVFQSISIKGDPNKNMYDRNKKEKPGNSLFIGIGVGAAVLFLIAAALVVIHYRKRQNGSNVTVSYKDFDGGSNGIGIVIMNVLNGGERAEGVSLTSRA